MRLYWKSDLQSMVSFHLGDLNSDNYNKIELLCGKMDYTNMKIKN